MWCHSACDVVKFELKWTIYNFAIQESSNFFSKFPPTSVEMSAEELPELKWSFKFNQYLSPSYNSPSTNYINLFWNSGATRPIPFRVRFNIANKKHEKINKGEYNSIAELGKSGKICADCIQGPQFHSEDLLSDKGHLTIFCEIETLSPIKTSLDQTRNDETQLLNNYELDSPRSLVENFQTLFEKKILADVTFKTGEKEFKAHKAILAVRSPVFGAMFQQEMQEKVSNQVHVLDIEPDVFQEILRFIYTNHISLTKMEELATELLSAADKYLLEDLKNKCENYLKSQMSSENCIEFLTLADHHSANYLKQDAVQFFRNMPAQVIGSEGWKKAKENDPAWLCEIMKSVFG